MRCTGHCACCKWRSSKGLYSLSLAATADEDAVRCHVPSAHLPGRTASTSSEGSAVRSAAHIFCDVSACSLRVIKVCVRCIHCGSMAMVTAGGERNSDRRVLRGREALVVMGAAKVAWASLSCRMEQTRAMGALSRMNISSRWHAGRIAHPSQGRGWFQPDACHTQTDPCPHPS
ncbi:hypothetical protein GALL_239630 [mine drainage metagenome]|uniref:Uncharacterized protein n=1 Tax=mine drainage metagenome TaxID=410659 RepID=A0A1J5RFA0_9ZZZZ